MENIDKHYVKKHIPNNQCEYFSNGVCLFAYSISDISINTDETICKFCQKEDYKPNSVIISLAINSARGNKDKYNRIISEYADLIKIGITKSDRLEKILNESGVGSQLWKLLELIGIKHLPSCSCLDWAEKMNEWGPELCDKNRTQIIEHMKKSAKSYGWGDVSIAVIKAIKTGIAFRLSILDPYGSLLDEAIRLAKEVDVSVKKN